MEISEEDRPPLSLTFVVDTSGERVGEINGLAVLQIGELAFGRPQRISATVTLGEFLGREDQLRLIELLRGELRVRACSRRTQLPF